MGVGTRALPPGVPGLSSWNGDQFVILLATLEKTETLTSFVLRLGVDRDELDPDRDGGRSLAPFKLLEPALSLPFSPTLSRSRLSSDAWSPFGRGDGVPCEIKINFLLCNIAHKLVAVPAK